MPGSTLLYVILEALLLPWVMLYLLAGASTGRALLRGAFGAGLPAMDGSLWVQCRLRGRVPGREAPDRGRLKRRTRKRPLVVSTVTLTGAHVAQGAKARHVFFPFDLPIVVERFLSGSSPAPSSFWKPKIWPYLLRACHRRGIPVAICKRAPFGKILPALQKIRPGFCAPFSGNIPLILAQADPDAERFPRRWGRRGWR